MHGDTIRRQARSPVHGGCGGAFEEESLEGAFGPTPCETLQAQLMKRPALPVTLLPWRSLEEGQATRSPTLELEIGGQMRSTCLKN